MADSENFDKEEGEELQEPQKKGFSVSPFLIKILGIVAAVIGIIIICVIVVIVMSHFMQPAGGSVAQGEQITKVKREHYEYLNIDDPFRQQLMDGKMVQLKISLGYKSGDKKTQNELSQIIPEVRDIVIKHLGRLRGEYFTDENALDRLEEDLLKQINRVLNNGKVEKIFFQEYTLILLLFSLFYHILINVIFLYLYLLLSLFVFTFYS